MKLNIAILCSCLVLFAFGALAATVGDPNSFAKYGVKQVTAWDAGATAPSCVGIPKQNSVAVRNFINDAGTGATMYCGFDTSVSQLTGMPVQANETLTVDIVALAISKASGSDSLTDGGVVPTAGAVTNQVCCIGAPGATPTDMHWMIVK